MQKTFAQNTAGRDYIVGDIHGCFTLLQWHLDQIGFDEERDRLFSVGDLVDRGPESAAALEWLAKPWFHAVRGNHEQMAIDYVAETLGEEDYARNGGAWFMAMAAAEQRRYASAFDTLPLVITLDTAAGPVGVIHAECAGDSWPALLAELAGEPRERTLWQCIWGRSRNWCEVKTMVAGVRAVVAGHTQVEQCTSYGNTIFIDTDLDYDGVKLTILDADTLQPVMPEFAFG